MRYNYKGFRGCDSCCDIEMQRRNDGKYVFVATEVPDPALRSPTSRSSLPRQCVGSMG